MSRLSRVPPVVVVVVVGPTAAVKLQLLPGDLELLLRVSAGGVCLPLSKLAAGGRYEEGSSRTERDENTNMDR